MIHALSLRFSVTQRSMRPSHLHCVRFARGRLTVRKNGSIISSKYIWERENMMKPHHTYIINGLAWKVYGNYKSTQSNKSNFSCLWQCLERRPCTPAPVLCLTGKLCRIHTAYPVEETTIHIRSHELRSHSIRINQYNKT